MISFILSIIALILGYFIYGKIVERIFGPDENALTPAKRLQDGVDYVEMDEKKTFLIQFLNIAGTGPIFGAVAGAMWGPAAFIWIVFGCIFAGAVHDYLIGMMSLRKDGASVAELVGDNLGDKAKQLMRVFSVVLLILVGVVFITSPAAILHDLVKSVPTLTFVGIIIVYYMVATVLPIDKVIGKIYPIFGICLLIMAVGIGIGLVVQGYEIPEITLKNYHPQGVSVFPYLCISIACGAISGFHATQSPMMARCLGNEKQGRRVFYGAMISEGIVALIWAAAAMSFFGGTPGLGEALGQGGAAVVVNRISNSVLGKVGGALAILGVVACPITSGDTAFRSARLTIADSFNIKQESIKNRFMIAIPLFVVGGALTFIDFNIVWRYFAWSNQTLAMIMLWTGSVFLLKSNKNYFITTIPAIFMTIVTFSYIMQAPEGFKLEPSVGNGIGLAAGLVLTVAFFNKVRKVKAERNKNHIA